MKRVNPFVIITLALVFSALSPAWLHAATKFEYVAKFVCGVATDDFRVLTGTYATSINIYNPNDKDVELNKNIALTFPPVEQAAGAVSDIIVEILAAKSALQVDCGEIPVGFSFNGGAPPPGPYTEGFLVIRGTGKLNVSGVYTATDFNGGVSVDIEQIQGVKVRVRRDNNKLTICHFPPGNPANAHTLRIGSSAWPAHEAHGDLQGSCP